MHTATVTHCSPTRIRVRVPSKRHDRSFFELLEQEFKTFSGVAGVEINPLTASVLLVIQGDMLATRCLVESCQWLEFKVFHKAVDPDSVVDQASRLMLEANRILKDATAGLVDVPSILFVMLLGLGVWQVSQGKILASASALLMSSLSFLPIRRAE